MKFKPGNVVIVDTNQAGTVWQIDENNQIIVILANGDLWYGSENQMRLPKNLEELKNCPKNLEHFSNRNGNYTRKP